MCVCAHTHTQLLIHVLFFWDPRTVVSVPGSSVDGILQVRILEWVAISFRGSPNPGLEPMSPTWQADSLPPSHLGIYN